MSADRRLRRLARRWTVDGRQPDVSLTYRLGRWYVEVELTFRPADLPRVRRANAVARHASARAALRAAERLDDQVIREHLRGNGATA